MYKMLFLEDFLEIIENLASEIRHKLTNLRELDLQIINEKDVVDKNVKAFFNKLTKTAKEGENNEYMLLRNEHVKLINYSLEKIEIVNELYELVDKYLRRLDQELQKFKLELEADNAGITEVLEKRALKADQTPSSGRTGEKRKLTSLASTSQDNFAENPNDNNNEYEQNTNQKGTNTNLNINNPSTTVFDSNNCLTLFNSKLQSDKSNNNRLNITGPVAIAAIASQAIAATQNSHSGRQSASFKASCQAVYTDTNVFSNVLGNNQIRIKEENLNSTIPFTISNDLNETTKRPRMKRTNKSTQNNIEDEQIVFIGDKGDISLIDDDTLYCYCNNVSYGRMIYCEGEKCPFQWFHYACVGIEKAPDGPYFCPTCTNDKNLKKNKIENKNDKDK